MEGVGGSDGGCMYGRMVDEGVCGSDCGCMYGKMVDRGVGGTPEVSEGG